MSPQAAMQHGTERYDGLRIAVAERRGAPGEWGVEAIDMGGDGDCYVAIFSGPDAKARAEEYASMKYGLAVSG